MNAPRIPIKIRYIADSHFDTQRSQQPTTKHEADNTAPSLPTQREQQIADTCTSTCFCCCSFCVRRTSSVLRATNNRRKSCKSNSSARRIKLQDIKSLWIFGSVKCLFAQHDLSRMTFQLAFCRFRNDNRCKAWVRVQCYSANCLHCHGK